MVGTTCFCVGFLIEMLVNVSFLFVILGTVVIAAGQPFIINCPAKIATFWFLKENVSTACILETLRHFTVDCD